MLSNFLRLCLFSALARTIACFNAAVNTTDGGRTCTNPQVRKEWRSLTASERTNWISACLARMPRSGNLTTSVDPSISLIPSQNPNSTWYDDFSYVHMDLNTRIHSTGLFLPWHRHYVWSYEQFLKELCGFTGVSPYWDWSLDADDFKNGTIFDPTYGLGSWGNPDADQTVEDGGFSQLELAYPIPHILRRWYTPFPYLNLTAPLFTQPNMSAASAFTKEQVAQAVNNFTGDFKSFQTFVEAPEGMHGSVHLILGGDLGGTCPQGSPSDCVPGPKWSPNEPMFWLHHGMIDKVWYDYQNKHPENYWAFDAGTVEDFVTWPKYPVGAPPQMHFNFSMPTDGILKGPYTVGDVFSTVHGPYCYVYE